MEQTKVRSTFSEETVAATVLQVKETATAGLQPIRQYIAELIFDRGLLPQLADARLLSPGLRSVDRYIAWKAMIST